MGETNQCDGCQRGLPVDTQGTHYDPAEAGVDAWSRYRIGCTRKRYAEPDPRDAEIARLQAELARAEALNRINVCAYCHAQFQRTPEDARRVAQHILCCEKNPLTVALHRVAGERDEARAQLAAAQADNAALRGALDMAHEVVASVADSWPIAFERVTEALANPAPGAPLLDAVERLVRAGARLRHPMHARTGSQVTVVQEDQEASRIAWDEALAAVRAVLSRAQDTAGISRGGGGE